MKPPLSHMKQYIWGYVVRDVSQRTRLAPHHPPIPSGSGDLRDSMLLLLAALLCSTSKVASSSLTIFPSISWPTYPLSCSPIPTHLGLLLSTSNTSGIASISARELPPASGTSGNFTAGGEVDNSEVSGACFRLRLRCMKNAAEAERRNAAMAAIVVPITIGLVNSCLPLVCCFSVE